jgi:glutamate-5-semialdehyde dehydrogenase
MRIGSDALGTAIAIEETSIAPALEAAGLPAGAITLVRSRAHAAAHALFTMAEVRLAIARGSGPAVALLGSIAEQHGIPASLHGTGGGWLYIAGDADAETARNAIANSIDRKVCNTLNVLLVAQRRAHDLAPLLSDVLCGARVHVVVDSKEFFAHGDVIGVDDLATEWEWEDVPELSLCVVRDDDEAADLVNRYSPRLVASIVTPDRERFERFYERVDTPYVGHGFTRWVDGQWAWGRPELGLTNWERGRLLGRSGILSGDDVFTVRDVWIDRSGKATQRR